MNDEVEKISYISKLPPFVPEEFIERQEQYHRAQIVSVLVDRMKSGEWYTIKFDRQLNVVPMFGDNLREYETIFYVGKVKPVHYEYVPKPKLTFRERLHVLFTGEIPQVLKDAARG